MPEPAVRIQGWAEFIRDLHQVPSRYQRQVRASLRNNAKRIVNAAVPLAQAFAGPHAEGRTESHTSISVGVNRVRITWSEPQAGVLEFGKDYQRRNRSSGGTHTVHMLPEVETPRFAYRAWEKVRPRFADDILDDLAVAAAATGFWELGR